MVFIQTKEREKRERGEGRRIDSFFFFFFFFFFFSRRWPARNLMVNTVIVCIWFTVFVQVCLSYVI